MSNTKSPNSRYKWWLTIWSVEPRDAWDLEQRTISLADGDERHILVRLWRKGGEGYAIVLEYAPSAFYQSYRRWQYCVFRQTWDQPRGYGFYSRSECSAPLYKHIWSWDIGISRGETLRLMPSGASFLIVDIEVAKDTAKPVDASVDKPWYFLHKSGIRQPNTRMPRWRPEPPFWSTPEELRYQMAQSQSRITKEFTPRDASIDREANRERELEAHPEPMDEE